MGICSKITFQHTSALCRTSGSLQIFRVVQTPPTNILSQRAPQWPNPFQWLCFTKAHAGAEETCIKNSGVAVLLWEWRVEKTKHSEREKLKHLLSGIVLTRSWRGLDLVLSCYILANSRGSSYGHSCFQFIFKSQVPASSQDLPRTHTHTDSLSLCLSLGMAIRRTLCWEFAWIVSPTWSIFRMSMISRCTSSMIIVHWKGLSNK